MKTKLLGLLLLFTLLLAGSANADNDQPPSGHNALRKLGRGVANILFGVVEVPNQITKTAAEHGGAGGVTYGVGKGFVRWFARELTGAYEVVTFPVPFPRGYKPVMKPEFPNEDYEP
ncbi:MAG TPA: exosortase system-associated protein, TIGR04073 family [Verrucomicrobiae bacterium]|nr:exosortase system-associated protein, TIGR04073 family [Verrucomicrobiae bacterium]